MAGAVSPDSIAKTDDVRSPDKEPSHPKQINKRKIPAQIIAFVRCSFISTRSFESAILSRTAKAQNAEFHLTPLNLVRKILSKSTNVIILAGLAACMSRHWQEKQNTFLMPTHCNFLKPYPAEASAKLGVNGNIGQQYTLLGSTDLVNRTSITVFICSNSTTVINGLSPRISRIVFTGLDRNPL